MIRNYIKTAWRNIINNKFYAIINVTGLTFGLIVGMFILLWVQDELSFDKFNKKSKEIYKIGILGGTGPTQQIFSQIIAPVATFAKNELPDVIDGVRIKRIGQNFFKYKDKTFIEENQAFTDASYFSVFDFNLINGNKSNPFPDNNSAVITKSTAEKYFGNDNPIGKVITLVGEADFKVTGVINDYPATSTFKYNILLPLKLFNQVAYIKNSTSYNGTKRIPSMDADWISFNYDTYLQLKPNANIAQLQKGLQRIHERNKPDDAPVPYVAQPLLQMHLYKMDGSDGGIGTVKTFAIVALLILIIACINYVNLSTARSMLRAREVSMRKIIGAGKSQLFLQFMVETTFLFLLATLLSIGLMYVLLPYYNSFSGKQLELSLTNYNIWTCIAITLIGTLAASSIYPALLLSSFEPLKALKGKITAGIGNTTFRKVLVVTQFTVSIVLIISTLIIGSQLKYIRDKNLGYNKENVFSFGMRKDMIQHYEAVKAELLKQPGIKDVTRSGDNIVDFNNWTGDNDWEGKPANSNLLFHAMPADKDFISFFKVKMSEGSNFTGAIADSAHFIINEAAVSAMGIKDPIGKSMRVWKTKGIIIGVTKDFHFASMHKKIEPVVFVFDPKNSWRIYIKTTGKDAQQAIASSQKLWKQYYTDVPFSYTFLDESYNKLYASEQHTGALFNLFAAVAILISCLGLLALATYTAQLKVKEIGIRKVLGASISGITTMLSKDFLLLVILSIVIAAPIAWYTMNKWLLDFAYRTNIQWWVFVSAGLGALIIAFITISFQAIKAALTNPVKSLRSSD
jgi:putative ABC transport system permease protein